MRDVSRMKVNIDIKHCLCDISLFVYLCVLFAHQRETMVEMILRYGSMFLVIISFLFAYPPIRNEKGHFVLRLNKFKIWMIVFCVYAALSSLWAIDASKTNDVILNLIKVGVVCMFIMPQLKTQEGVERSLWIMLLALIYMVLLLLLRTPFSQWGTERIGTVIGQHSNVVGRLVALGAILAFYFYTAHKKYNLFLVGIICMFCGASLLTGSKNAIFIMVFQLALYWVLISKNWKRILQVFIIIGFAIVVLYFVMTNEFLYAIVGVRMERMFSMLTGGGDVDGSTSERLYFMKVAWDIFKKHPIFGVGLNNFSAYLATIGYRNAVYSHCGFLELLSTTGIIGFSVFYYMYIFVLKILFKPAVSQEKLAALFFAVCLRIFIFDMTTISVYDYNTYIILTITYCFVRMKVGKN